MNRFPFPLLLLGSLVPFAAFAQPAPPPPALPATVAARVQLVENSLLPYVPVQGLPGWNLQARMRLHRVPGLSIAVIHNYKVEWAKAYGMADTTARTPATTRTLFAAGSISKLVSATAALVLVQQGKMALDQPINSYLTSWKLGENDLTKAQPVTLRLLLSHRAGTSQSAYFGFVPRAAPLPSVVDILSGQPNADCRPVVVNQPPGKGFSYSGGGYLVAQQALMDVTGQAFAPLTEQLLFKPLGLRSTTFAQPLPRALQRRAAWAYSENSWFKGMPYVYPQQAPAGLYATPTDLANFLIEIQQAYRGRGQVLSQATAQALLTPQAEVSTGTFREQMGLGAFLLQRADCTDESSRYFEHTGVNAGFLAYAIGSVSGGEGVVIMMNNNNGADELGKELRRAVAKVYGWPGFLPPAIQPVVRPAAELDAWAGRYQHGPDETVTFRRADDHLLQRFNDGPEILAYPLRGDTLAFTDYPMRAVFARDATGRITGYRMAGSSSSYPRLRPDQLLPNELLRAGRIAEAVAGYRAQHLNEYQLTYLAYELLNRRPTPNLRAVEGLLTLAREQFPASAVVLARWGDLHARRGETPQAITAYQAALRLNPDDKELQEKLVALRK